jgi:UDP-N-acetylglucosamine/UDP-N-acetylgalactosamine diphosphorylase
MKHDRSLRARLAKAGQEFLADHGEGLDPARRNALLTQLEGLDLDLLADLHAAGEESALDGNLEPLPYIPFAERGRQTAAAARGVAELEAGRVAFALLAGGQASRLRWDGPKGTYPVGPVTDRCLFRIYAEHVLRAGRDYGRQPPLAVTTSAATDAAIRAFFERQDCFAMDRAELGFACQASLPALDDCGRLLLCAPDRIFTSPDGHGGAVLALEREGILAGWEEAGITTVVTFQVDNPLLQVVDPDFIGRLHTGDASLATKVILKERPEQKLGVLVRRAGRAAIVEYLARDLPLHTARKEIPCVDDDGAADRRWGVKFERFLFDLFPRAAGVVVAEVLRKREYAPIKNADGNESPETARAMLDAEYRRWYREAGREPPLGERIELSPLDALGPEDL